MLIQQMILLVDYGACSRNTIAVYLRLHGYVVETATTELEFARALTRSFDLVLLETRLTDGGGLAIYRPLPLSPVLPGSALTRIREAADSVTALELGADDYVAHPFNPRELLARIRAVLR